MEHRARGLTVAGPAHGGPEAAKAPGFQAGGALRDASLYIERRADAELLEGLARGELCAVVAPRRMGKSSLRRRAEQHLAARGVRCLAVDLGLVGTAGATEATWFSALSFLLAERARDSARADPFAFFRVHEALPPARRFARFLREELCADGDATAIFIDELDVALGLPFPVDSFFEALGALSLGSAGAGERPIAAALFGVTPPERWTPSARCAPAARVIALEAFTREQAAAFLPGLAAAGGDAAALLHAVLAVTRGHPYLTQRLCELLAQRADTAGSAPVERVARLIEDELLEDSALRALL